MGRSVTRRAALPDADWAACAIGRQAFIERVLEMGAEHYRDLPWRGIEDPYGVLVSEVMLQQTQVARVLRYWERWMGMFPTVDALASADTATVLEAWQGLGYNRRALSLKRSCEECAEKRGGMLPDTASELEALPGIGPATAAGVIAFAFDKPSVYLETNVRSVFLHELFPESENVADKVIVPYVSDTCPSEGVRAWYYALLDYGAHLKAILDNPSRRSRHYARQSSFAGSRREKRSFVLRFVLASPEGAAAGDVRAALDRHERDAGRDSVDRALFDDIVDELVGEGFFRSEDGMLIA